MNRHIIKKDLIINLKWHGELPPVSFDELEWAVREDIEENLRGLKRPGDLMFHTIFLGHTPDDNIVTVWGEETDPNTFHCRWVERVNWVSIRDID